MKSRAELLAEIEEKRHQNKDLMAETEDLQVVEAGRAAGYNPYDNPGIHKATPDDDVVTARRRALLRGKKRR